MQLNIVVKYTDYRVYLLYNYTVTLKQTWLTICHVYLELIFHLLTWWNYSTIWTHCIHSQSNHGQSEASWNTETFLAFVLWSRHWNNLHNSKQSYLLYQTVNHCDHHMFWRDPHKNKEKKVLRLLKTTSFDCSDQPQEKILPLSRFVLLFWFTCWHCFMCACCSQ